MNFLLIGALVAIALVLLGLLWLRQRMKRHREEAELRKQGQFDLLEVKLPPAPSPEPYAAELAEPSTDHGQLDGERVATDEAARREAEAAAQAEAERLAAEAAARAEAERLAAEAAARAEAERLAAEAAAQAEAERLAAEAAAQAEAERLAAEAAARAEAEHLAAEAAARAEAERLAAEAAAQAEAERLAAEAAARAEAERLAAEATAQAEAERLAAEAAARAEAERLAAAEAARLSVPTRPLAPEETIVMIADDSKIVRVKTSRLLAQHHYRVVLAESAEEAIEKMAAELPHVLITDVEMPGMDGFDLTRHVRAAPATAQLPVIMITSSDDRKEAAAAAGVSTLLGKPYPEDQLVACIEQARLAVQVPA